LLYLRNGFTCEWGELERAFIEQICASQLIFSLTVPYEYFEFLNKIIIE